MAERYLLDTNILSDLVRQPQGTIAGRIAAAGESHVCTSVIVACELRFGAVRSNSARIMRQVDAILDAMEILAFEAPADRHYAAIRHALERKGVTIGGNDLLIAAHARAIGATCVTANTGEFRRVPGLRVENWLR